MFISPEAVKSWEASYGTPRSFRFSHEVSADEIDTIIASQKDRRAHDVTFFITEGENVVVMAKHNYPSGIYRAPGGGLKPGESLEAGAGREAREETGLDIFLEHYLVRAEVRFFAGEKMVDWTTHVFAAKRAGGRLEAIDTHEISEVRRATLNELQGPIRQAMIDSGRRLMAYRVWLTDETIAALGVVGERQPRRRPADRA